LESAIRYNNKFEIIRSKNELADRNVKSVKSTTKGRKKKSEKKADQNVKSKITRNRSNENRCGDASETMNLGHKR